MWRKERVLGRIIEGCSIDLLRKREITGRGQNEKNEDWPPCKNVTDVRAFIGLCVYYRIWMRDFSVIPEPLFRGARVSTSTWWALGTSGRRARC